ncbi:MAG: hypothetical protein GW893_19840 [Armatimonadetes bacterium]|nr:hypothetical protein [Armatimonadota bacterium]
MNIRRSSPSGTPTIAASTCFEDQAVFAEELLRDRFDIKRLVMPLLDCQRGGIGRLAQVE